MSCKIIDLNQTTIFCRARCNEPYRK